MPRPRRFPAALLLLALLFLLSKAPTFAGELRLTVDVPTISAETQLTLGLFNPTSSDVFLLNDTSALQNTSVSSVTTTLGGTLSAGGGSFNFGGGAFQFIDYGNYSGGVIIGGGGGNRAPVGQPVTKTLPHGPIASPIEFRIPVHELASDPDGHWMTIRDVTGSANWSIADDGQTLVVLAANPVELTVAVTDPFGAQTVAWLSIVNPPVFKQTQQIFVNGSEEELTFDVVRLGYPPEELLLSLTKNPFTGSIQFADRQQVIYRPMNSFIGNDSFDYSVSRNGVEIARISIVIRNAAVSLYGSYTGLSAGEDWIARLTLELTGEYTLSLRSATTTIRRKGNIFQNNGESAGESAVSARVFVTLNGDTPELRLSMSAPGEGAQEFNLWTDSALGTLSAGRVHALLTTTLATIRLVYPIGIYVVKKPANKLPESYAVLLRGTGSNVTLAGRLFDGRPWAGSSFVLDSGSMPIVAQHVSGWLESRSRGNVTGVLQATGPNKSLALITVGGSAFIPKAPNVNVYKGQYTPVRVRSAFPSTAPAPAHLDAAGAIKATVKPGVVYALKANGATGALSGTISLPAIGESRPVNGLFIPHKQKFVGFVGDENPKPLTVERR